jgi:hypothetical protein
MRNTISLAGFPMRIVKEVELTVQLDNFTQQSLSSLLLVCVADLLLLRLAVRPGDRGQWCLHAVPARARALSRQQHRAVGAALAEGESFTLMHNTLWELHLLRASHLLCHVNSTMLWELHLLRVSHLHWCTTHCALVQEIINFKNQEKKIVDNRFACI